VTILLVLGVALFRGWVAPAAAAGAKRKLNAVSAWPKTA
jgi:hypothetical protein